MLNNISDEERLSLLFKYLFTTEDLYQSKLNQIEEEFSRHEFHSDYDLLRLLRAESELMMFNKIFSDLIKILFDF